MPRPTPTLRALVASVALFALAGLPLACGGSVRETAGSVEYSVSAQQNYERGLKKLKDEEFLEAAKYFGFVKARFPYSKFAVLADLRLADAALGAESYLEAVDLYKLFIKFHPTHELVENGYAAFRIGEAYYHMLPDDWFLVPPAFEKDQSAAHDAARELGTVVRNYPGSPFAKRAQELYDKVAHLLASHEWYVAEFYWKRNQPMGTIMRLRALLKNYSGAGFDEAALFLLGEAYVRTGHKEDARKSFETLLERFPQSPRAGDARQQIATLGG